MGLFDPPAVSIRKKLPLEAQAEFASMCDNLAALLPSGIDRTKSALIVAVVMGAWIASESRLGRVALSSHNGRYIQNMVGNCYARLGEYTLVATSLIEQLTEEGFIMQGGVTNEL